MATFKFNPIKVSAPEPDISFISLLPEYLQTRENTKFFNTTVQQLFNKEQSEDLSGYVGRKPGSYYNFIKDNYVKELTPDRQNYQLEPTMVSETSTGDIYSTFFYNDLIDKLASQGGITNNHDRLFKQEYYSFAPLIDLDKFANYSNYYWSATGSTTLIQEESFTNLNINLITNSINIPGYGYKNGTIVKFIGGAFNPSPLVNNTSYQIIGIDENNFQLADLSNNVITITTPGVGTFLIQPQTIAASIIGQQFASLPDGTPLSNGMRVVFTNDALLSNNGTPYIVEGVGTSIILINDSAFSVQTNASEGIPDYITIQRGSTDGNAWSTRNRWFHKDLIQGLNQTNTTLVQAHRPIIEFFRNMQLYNFGNYSRANVDLVYSSGNIQSLTGLPAGTLIDGVAVQDNDRILVINDQDPERTNRIFLVYGIGNANAISLAIETDGQNKFGQPVIGESVNVNSGTQYGGETLYYNGTAWVQGQHKSSYNQAPLFYLYDSNGVKLDDIVEYPNSTFAGSTMFQYDTSPLASLDPVLGLNVVVDSFGTPEFTNTLETQIYTYLSNFLTTNIPGYYFAYSYGLNEFINHWHKAPFDSKQNILDQFIIGNQQNIAPSFTVKAATSGINIPGFISGGVLGTGIGDQIFNVNLASGIIDGVTTWAIGDQVLLTNQDNGSQNGIYEYVSGTTEFATLIRPASFDTSSEIIYDMAVAVKQGTVNSNKSFIMIQTETLDWSLIPMLWSVQTTAHGLQRVYDLSQVPESVADYLIATVSTNNVPGYSSGVITGINLANTFDSTISYYYGLRILLKDQTNSAQNGVYVYTAGSASDATLSEEPSYIVGSTFLVTSGTFLNYMYELQVSNSFIKVPKPEDNIQVQLNGTPLVNYRDFEVVTDNVLILSLTLPINLDDLLQIWTYSPNGPVANYTGFYEIPLNLESNANNAYVTTARYDDLTTQFSSIISNQSDFSGSPLGNNNYRDTSQNLGLGTGILQHSAPMLKLMMVNSLASTDIMTSMQYVENEYVRFYNKFLNTINLLKTQGYTDTTSYENWVFAALNKINIGKNSTFPFASNNVGSGTFYIPPSPAFLGITPIYRPQKFIDYTANTPLRVIRFHDGQLKPAYDNPITSPDINPNQTIITASGIDTYTLNNSLVFSWEIIVEANNSPLVPEVDYTVSTGSTLSFLVLLNPLPAGTSIFVEWSNNILDQVILYLETMIYDSICSTFKQNDNVLTDGNVYYSSLQERPGYFRTTDFSRTEWNEIAQLDFNRWVSTNKVSADSIVIYNESNPFTWNYSKVTDPKGNNLPGYWRGIFKYFYDTDRPNTNPWEMFGFTEKPYWWNSVYGPAPYTNSNFALWSDAATGTIRQGARAGTYAYLTRPEIMNYIPVDDAGNILDPITIGIATTTPLTPISSSVESNYMIYANAPFVFGDLGPLEYAWQSSANGSFGLAETMYLVKPAKFVEYFWETNHFIRIFPSQQENQLIIQDPVAGIDNRPPNSEAVIYTENSADLLIGIQQNIVDYLISTGQKASFLGDRIRGANAHLAYRASGFIDAQNMTASVDSFGNNSINNTTLNILPPNTLYIPEDNLTADSLIIPSDDIRVTLQVSPAIQELSYSALMFTNNNLGYYEISGYDFSNQYFMYYKPITTSASVSVNVGGKQPTLSPWAPGILYTVGTYVTNNNIIYRAITQNISGTNFTGDLNYWIAVQTVPLVGGITVTQYSKYETTPTILPYNTRFFTPQNIADFMFGYQKYLQTQGWEFNTTNTDGTVNDFGYMLQQVLAWILANNPDQNIIIVSPLASLATFVSQLGYVDNLQNNISGMPTVLDKLGFSIPIEKLAVTRFGNTFTVQTLPSNTDQQIYGIKLNVVVVEHVVVFNDETDFNDLIYSPLLDVRQERIYISVTRALNWNGQLSAPGFLIQTNGISANFDKSVNDFTKFYDPNTQITASNIGLAAKAMFGFQKSQALTNILMNEQDQFKFYQGFLKEKGTSPSFNKLLRSSYISDLNQVDFYEEWMVRLGAYGAVEAESIIEIGLVQDDIRNNPQIVEFTTTNYQDPTSNIIQIGPNDPRYLYKNFKNLTVNQFTLDFVTPSLPTAGYAMLTDAKLLVSNYADLTSAVSTYLLTNTFANADRIWTAIGEDGYNWTMERIDFVANIMSIDDIIVIENKIPVDPYIVMMDANPGLAAGELVIIQGCKSAINNGIFIANNITNNPLIGTIVNPVGISGNLIINGVTVTIHSADSAATIVSEINTASIPNVIASLNSSNYIQLVNSIGSTITISDSVSSALLTALGLTTGTFSTSSFELFDLYGNTISASIPEPETNAQVFRLHNVRFASADTSITGTIQNPVLTANLSFTVNGHVINLVTGNSVLDAVTAINAASIPNITAINFFGKLQIQSSNDSDIILSPWNVAEFGLESSTPLSGWDNVNDLWFFDNYNNTGTWGITLPTDVLVRSQEPQVDINYIKFVALMDGLTDIKLLDLNLYNPYQNVLPRNVEQQIDFMFDEDPAQYNDGTNTAAQQPGLAWVNEQIGRVWWDLSQVRYLDYDQGDLLYRYNNWGAVFPRTKVAIYEWTSSPVTPDNWTAYVTTGAGVNLYSTSSTPKYTDRYVTDYVYDPAQGATVPVYYFWIGNNNLVPQVDFRTIDIVTLQSIITNPTTQGTAWFSPIDSNICLVANVEQLLTDTTLLQIAFNDYKTKNKRHTHWALIRENETIDPPPTELWEKMKDSLVTFVKITDTLPNLESNGISIEMFDALQAEGNVVQQIATVPTYSVYLPVPDTNLLYRQAYGNLYRPRQSWFNDPIAARQKFVQIANYLMNKTNWIDVNSDTWNVNLSIQQQLLETPTYTVGTLAEMYALLTTPNFNNGSTIYVINDVTQGGNWSFWRYDSSSSAKFILLQVQTYNTNLYWERVDWYASGYSSSIITAPNVIVFANLTARNSYSGTFTIGQVVYITDNGDGTWAAYEYQGVVGNVTEWVIVAHQEATVNFLKNLYDFSTVSPANLAFAEHAASEAMIHIIDGFNQNLSTVQNQNEMVVGLIREAYRQNISVDWAFKSSYISATGLEQPLDQSFLYQPDVSNNIFDYLNSAKPFHSKFRGLVEIETTADDVSDISIVETIQDTISLRFDAVSIHPNQALIESVLSLPNITAAEKEYRQQQINSQFTEAERVAVFTNYDPKDVLPGALYRGIDIDGVNFNDFSTLFGLSLGYDNSPYDNILGYDYDATAPINLYDVFINGKKFTDIDANEIIIDGDKFKQPYLAEGRPEQLVQTQVGDTLNIVVYSQDLTAASGYDVWPYDDEDNGTQGYDFVSPPANVFVAYNLFKNITDQWQFLRISDSSSTYLTQPLSPYDTEVVVNDATVLSQPDIANRIPGVIFVGSSSNGSSPTDIKERIIFWQVDTTGGIGNHKLKQILRGTSGTPWGVSYPIDITVRDAGKSQVTVPGLWSNWVVTPQGISLDNGPLGQFLQEEQGSYTF